MRILVVGGGGREDALSWRLARSASCTAIMHAPGNAGTLARGENWPIEATDGRALVARAKDAKIDLAVIGPESAIAAGVADRFRDAGIATFAPGRTGGRLESSKIYAKRFLERHGIPTARARVVHSFEQAERELEDRTGGCVVKADGLAAGKGVVVAPDTATARAVLRDWYANHRIPGGGSDVLIEDLLEGRELSVFAIADGRAMIPLAAACDYKRAGDGDRGPNTGGMGAYSPPVHFPPDFMEVVRDRIIAPTWRGLLAEDEQYIGILYCGLMWTTSGPSVIEFNVRFGDPETQVLVPRIQGDFARLCASAARGALEIDAAAFSDLACVGVSLATSGYPKTSTPVHGLPTTFDLPVDVNAFWGSSTVAEGRANAAGGRVMTIVATGADVGAARAQAYAAIDAIRPQLGNAALTYRTDIARF